MSDVQRVGEEFEKVKAPQLPRSQQEVATQAFESAVSPLREQFKERVEGTTEELSKRGIAFGGVGGERLRDVFKEQQRIEGQLAGQIGSQLGRTALDQAFQASEAAKSRSLQRELQQTGFEFQAGETEKGREFGAEQAQIGRDFQAEQALLGREFTSQEADKQREFQDAFTQNREEFQALQADIDRQENRNRAAIQLALSGNLSGDAVNDILDETFGPGTVLTTQDEADLQRIATASGLSTEDYLTMRRAIGQGQLRDVLQNPNDYIVSPGAAREFQLKIAALEKQAKIDAAKAQSEGGKVLCTYYNSIGMIPDRIFVADIEYAEKISNEVVLGYHLWGKPMVRLIKRNKLISKIIFPFVNSWAHHMAYKMNVTKKVNVLGMIMECIGIPICYIIGKCINFSRRLCIG